MTLALASALDVPMASVVRVLAMDAMEPTANVTKTSVLVTKKNNAVLENKQSIHYYSLHYALHVMKYCLSQHWVVERKNELDYVV